LFEGGGMIATSAVFSPAASKSISQRIVLVIDRFEGGNASALAKRCAYSQTGIGKIVRGETVWPSSQLLSAIVLAYHVDPAWLLMGVPSGEFANARKRVVRDAAELAVRHAKATLERLASGYVEVEDAWG